MVHLPLHQRAHKVELERHHLRAKPKCVEVVLPGACAYGHAAVSWVLPFPQPLLEALRVGHLDAHRRHDCGAPFSKFSAHGKRWKYSLHSKNYRSGRCPVGVRVKDVKEEVRRISFLRKSVTLHNGTFGLRPRPRPECSRLLALVCLPNI